MPHRPMSLLMNERLIELGLLDETDRDRQQTCSNSTSQWASLVGRLVTLISATTVESDSLSTHEFRSRLESYRLHLENSAEGDAAVAVVANECLHLCEDYLRRARQYLLEREGEFAEVIGVMRVAIGKLAGDAKAFNTRLMGSSDRIHRLAEIEDIRELKKRIYQEV